MNETFSERDLWRTRRGFISSRMKIARYNPLDKASFAGEGGAENSLIEIQQN